VIPDVEFDADRDSISDDRDISSTSSRTLDERLVGVIIGGTVVAILLLLGVVLFCVLRRRYGRKKYIACGVGVGGGAPSAADMCQRVPVGFHSASAVMAAGGPGPRPPVAVMPPPSTTVGNGKILSNGILYNSVDTCDDAEVLRSVLCSQTFIIIFCDF